MIFPHIASLLTPSSQCVLAFSGGLDSTVLLHQLMCWQYQQLQQLQLRVLHVHHGLNTNADRWATHCQHICQQWQIPCDVLHVKVDVRVSGIEAAARDVRYRVLFQQLEPSECLLTAQHLDDQCETLLLALKRGSGPAGLAAMPLQRFVNGHLHLRPLLNLSRQHLEAYADKHQLSWIEDETNSDNRYDRNFLRLQILPLLQARWPHFSATAVRSAALCGEQEQLLNELLAEKFEHLTDEHGALHFPSLLTMNEARRHALLRRWIAINGGTMPSREALKRITSEVMCSRKDAQPRIRFAKYDIRRYRQKLYWLPIFSSLSQSRLSWLDHSQPLPLPQDLGQLRVNRNIVKWRLPEQDEQIFIRFEVHGHYHFLGREGGCDMKKLWQELGIPPWQRKRTPLIYYNDRLIGAPELFTTHEGTVRNEHGWQVVWIK